MAGPATARAADYMPLVDSLARLHASIFGGTPAGMRPSAVHRAQAAYHVDLITSKRSQDPEQDWRQVYFALRRCYEHIKAQL